LEDSVFEMTKFVILATNTTVSSILARVLFLLRFNK